MTARPIRRNAQVPDRNGKIFYTSIASLSHLSKEPRDVSCVFTEPCLLPSAGGIILACRAAGNEVSEQMIENLRTAQHMRV